MKKNIFLSVILPLVVLISSTGWAQTPGSPNVRPSALVHSSSSLSLQGASMLLDQAVEKAMHDGVHPCIAIDDASGNLLVFKRLDGSGPGCVEAALKKANSAAANRVNTIEFYNMSRQHPAIGSIPGILPAVAGVLVHQGKTVVGSIGVAGGASDEEEQQFATELVTNFEKLISSK